MSSSGNLFILSAPSGSGKTSLAHRALAEVDNLTFSVSHTTRPCRKGEEEGRQYYFVSERSFKEMVEREEFLEWAEVYGNFYGTSRRFVEERLQSGIDVLLDIDIQGAFKVRNQVKDAVMVFVLPPSFEVLAQRLRGRGLDDEEVIERRLEIARSEIRHYTGYDYLLINRSLAETVDELRAIILATRCRVQRRMPEAGDIVRTFLL